MDYRTTVLESQLDWLTCSYHGEAKTRALRNFATDAASIEAKLGNDTEPFRLKGYVGWRVGRVRYGERDHTSLIQLSGQLADDYAGTLVPDADTITRADIAVTCRFDPPQPDYGERTLRDFAEYYRAHPRSAMPWHTSDEDGGFTCYVGARRSPTFFRLYNKQAESIASKDKEAISRYADSWRYELELHDAGARVVAGSAIRATQRSVYCSGYMHGYLEQHGVRPAFDYHAEPVYTAGFRRRSDADTRRQWFSRAVAPSIRKQLQTRSREEVLRDLGLSEDQGGSNA